MLSRPDEHDFHVTRAASASLERRWFVAFGDVVVVEAAFGLDASLTVVFAGVLAARHHQGTARVDAWRVRRCADGRGGLAQRWKQQPATGMGRVDLPTGRSPDDGAVGQLSSQPTPKRLEQVVFSTQAPQIRRTGRPPRIRDRMVQIAAIRRLITTPGTDTSYPDSAQHRPTSGTARSAIPAAHPRDG